MTYLCVPIFVESAEQAHRDAVLAAEAGADLVEYRIDTFDPALDGGLVARSPLPCVVTCRSPAEGGQSNLPDRERLALLATQLTAGAAYADVEWATYDSPARAALPAEGKLILSSHDFAGRPERLYSLFAAISGSPADVAKLVWTARTVRDNIEAFELLLQRQKPTIALCMGEAGLISRVLAKKFGAFLTFAPLRTATATAPGQVSIADIKRLYRWDAQNPRTQTFGVVGSPVGHSMSPAIHNASFDATGYDGVYVPLPVNPGYESFKAFAETFIDFAPLDLRGLSVTIPHKESALRYLKEVGGQVEPLAEAIGAVNTLIIDRAEAPGTHATTPESARDQSARSTSTRPALRGINTDYAAILDTITGALGVTREQLAGKRVAVLGAGGTGRTAVAALAAHGATVVVYNRTFERAEELAKEFDGSTGQVVAARWEKLCDSCCEVWVNTTPIGMSPNVDASPLDGVDAKHVGPGTLVFDTIYNPPETKLLKWARDRGAITAGGVEMFVRQAAAQFEAWTGQAAPTDVMRTTVLNRLGAR